MIMKKLTCKVNPTKPKVEAENDSLDSLKKHPSQRGFILKRMAK